MNKRPDLGNMEIWRELGTATEDTPVKVLREAKLIDISRIKPYADQPRKSFDEQALSELTESIRERGLLQPIVVRPSGDAFIIIAGHRRYRACQRVGMSEIPAIIREVTEQEALEQSLIENVQREDIKPVEEATCYRQLMDQHNYSIRDMATRVHKSVGYIHSRLKLIEYEDIAQSVQDQQIGIYEARELSKVEDEEARKTLIEKAASGELDREGLKEAVKIAIGQVELPVEEASTASISETEGEPIKQVDSGSIETAKPSITEAHPPTDSSTAEKDPAVDTTSAPNLQVLYRRWDALRQDLRTLDIRRLPNNKDRDDARRLLEAIRDTIVEMLD